MSTITWPGLPGGPITFSFPVYEKIVPAWRTLQRPGIKARLPRHAVQHSNGNPDALAAQDATYLQNGAGGRQASWHGTVDHKEGYIDLPADEVGWHAGDGAGPGNYNGFAVEYSEYPRYHLSAANHRKGRRNAAEMMGRVMARFDSVSPQHIDNPNYHKDYMRKGCPRVILENTVWLAEYEADFWFFFEDEQARMSGEVPVDPGFAVGDRFEVIADALNVRTGWGTGARLVGTFTAGRTGTIIEDGTGRFSAQADGYTWVNVRVDGFGTGWLATGLPGDPWIRETATPAPEVPPVTYAPRSPIPELLETNLGLEDVYNTAVAVQTVAEIDFIFVADVIEFKRTSPAQQYAGEGGKPVKAPYQEGDRAVAAWITQVADGTYWYLLAGGDDEWVRVRVTDTVRIADAPLLGDAAP